MIKTKNIPNGNVSGAGDAPAKPAKKQLTVEKRYQKKTQLEHILLRPDTYIGSVEPVTEDQWVYDEEEKKMIRRKLTFVPGLYKIFDEILVNAADHKQQDSAMNMIKIDISVEENTISIYNNGQGIPVVKHKNEDMFVPTMIFGHLLTSSNYDDEEEKVTGGRNGYGAKLCNIFSTKFVVETASSEYASVFKQVWRDNMSIAEDPKIKDFMGKDYTRVTFCPDLRKFNQEKLDKDIVDLMTRRAFDVAASAGVHVYLNGKKLPVHKFSEYVHLYVSKSDGDSKVVFEKVNERWEVALAVSDIGFQQVSFVNSIATTKGGRHVDHVSESIVKAVLEKANKKHKGGGIKPFQVKNHMWLFINCLIVNPTFDSQTKENMTLQAKSFGSKCKLSDTFFKNANALGLVELVVHFAKAKEEAQLAKTAGGKKTTKLRIPKLEDANFAGSAHSRDCTLILTEGDSAKTLVMAGLAVVGRDTFGVFPLRGKLLNVREASNKQIMDNAEITNITKIIGLNYKKKYETADDLKTLRYGKLLIMTDQDQDGSHIKGLLINFIHHTWPSLLRLPFLEEFITPIVKASKGNDVKSFFSMPEFERWKREEENWPSYKIKYYKGLGTSTSKEAKEYFSDMDRHLIRFTYGGSNDDSNINMAFSKKCVEQRKEWLTQWMETSKQRREMGLSDDVLYDEGTKSINYSDFINKELVLFSNSDNERSIPNLMDGFKPGQRKVMFTCLKRNDKKEVKVFQLVGSVAEHSAYHHGDASLASTIVNLAQNYVGSNNINLLLPLGQFGTRLNGGKDQASPRYIGTMMSPLARYLFHPDDDPLLDHRYDDNQKIEPVYYVPIIPLVLVNGADGIGTGWSTKIHNHNPRDIVNNLLLMLDGKEPVPMIPWYKNFRGTIEPYGASRYICFGEIALLGDDSLEITELPIGTWTESYKKYILDAMLDQKKDDGIIVDYKDYNTDTTVRFLVNLTRQKLAKCEEEGLHKTFKLQSTMNTTSMVLFDSNSCIVRYDSTTAILKEFYNVRLEYYHKRKAYHEARLQAESRKLSNQARFILEKCNGQLTIENKKRIAMVEELQKKGFDPDPVRQWKLAHSREDTLAEEMENEDDSVEESESESKKKYDYLLGMAMWTLTLEKKNELLKRRDEKLQECERLRKKSPQDLWKADLESFMKMLDSEEEKERKDAEVIVKPKAKKAISGGGAKGRTQKIAVPRSEDTKPSIHGERVVPKMDGDLAKKLEKIDKPKVKRVKKVEVDEEDKDELDDLGDKPMKSLKDRLGNSPEQIEKKLQAKRKNLKNKSPIKKAKSAFDDDSLNEDDDHGPVTQAPERTSSRRSAAAKVKYFDSDSEAEAVWDDDNDDVPLPSKKRAPDLENDSAPQIEPESKNEQEEDPIKNDSIIISETDSEYEAGPSVPKYPGGSDALFDSLLTGDSAPSHTEPEKKVPSNSKKPAASAPKKKAPVKRTKKKSYSEGSDSDDIFKSSSKKGKKIRTEDSSDEDFVVEEVKVSSRDDRTSRKRTTVKYALDSDDDFE